MKSSRLTSRQPPQSVEMRLNSDSIQSAAALTPVPGGRSASMLERVLRLLKLTSFSMEARMCSEEICWRAAAMAGSAGAGAMGLPVCWACKRPEGNSEAAMASRPEDQGTRIPIIVLLWKQNRCNNRKLDVLAGRAPNKKRE